eukprot:3818760-Rhodomonas_salina.5
MTMRWRLNASHSPPPGLAHDATSIADGGVSQALHRVPAVVACCVAQLRLRHHRPAAAHAFGHAARLPDVPSQLSRLQLGPRPLRRVSLRHVSVHACSLGVPFVA